MRVCLSVIVCVLFVCLIGGCQKSQSSKNDVEVIVEDGGQFPDYLVGRWRADKHGWEFVFEPDGTISSAVISLGRIRMKPGEVTTVPMKLGGEGIFKPGRWMVSYSSTNRELTVKVVLEEFYAEMGSNVLEGSSNDIFVGPISPDGNVWQAQWTAFPKYTAHTDEYPNFDLETDQIYGEVHSLTFEKIIEE